MNKEHTPGPWRVEKQGKLVFIETERRGHCIVGEDGPSWEDGRRIVACVNYCEGVSTAEIEAAPKHMNLRGLLDFWDNDAPKVNANQNRLASLNRELVEALRYWLPTECPIPTVVDGIGTAHKVMWQEARAVLAKVKS